MNIIETNLTFSSMSVRTKTNRIIIHHADATNCTAEDIHRWHRNNGWAGAGYHYLVRKDGNVYRLRPEKYVGAHASGRNSDSIGICFEGNFMHEVMGSAQKEAGKELVADIKARYSISKVQKHSDVCATSCPGTSFPFAEIAGVKAANSSSNSPNASNASSNTSNALKSSKVLEWQKAAIADGFRFPKYGADGVWGAECAAVAKVAIVKKRTNYIYQNLTKIVQRAVGTTVDGMCGTKTDAAIRAYQRKYGLAVDGCVGINTWKKILGV